MTELELSLIRTDGGTQPRNRLNKGHIQDLVEALEQGKRLEPMDIFYDGSTYWLSDGFHRHAAYQQTERRTCTVNIFQGTLRDAILHGIQGNAKHTALKLSRDDKRRAVLLMLNDPEWSLWSDREIARRCAVSDRFVNKLRQELTANRSQSGYRKGADGRIINTTKIGHSRTSSNPSDEPEVQIENNSQPESTFAGRTEKQLLGEVKSESRVEVVDRTQSIVPYLNRCGSAKVNPETSIRTSLKDMAPSTKPQSTGRQLLQTSTSELKLSQSTIEPKPDCPDSLNQLEEQILGDEAAQEGSEPFGHGPAPQARFKLPWFGKEIEIEGKIAAVLVRWQHQGRAGQTQIPIEQVSSINAGNKRVLVKG